MTTQMPSLDGATGWLNSEPLGPAELRGHVVLVNFWTLTCINWLRPEPYLRAWSQAYREEGLVVIGAHTPEFAFEREMDRIRLSVLRSEAIDYPVAVDSDYKVWTGVRQTTTGRRCTSSTLDGVYPRPALRRGALRVNPSC